VQLHKVAPVLFIHIYFIGHILLLHAPYLKEQHKNKVRAK